MGACSPQTQGADGGPDEVDLTLPPVDAPDLAMAAAPVITAVDPLAASNAGGATLTITGSGFLTGATVTIGGTAGTAVTINSATKLTVTAPAKAASCGLSAIEVKNTDGKSASRADLFRYLSSAVAFNDAQNIAMAATPRAVLVSDIDGDNKADLISVNSGNSSGTVRLGTGAGAFAAAVTFHSVAGTQPYGLAIADFNGDGKKDIITVNNASNDVYVYLGQGGTTFAAAKITAVGASPYAVAVADFNKDNKADIAVANSGSNNVSIRLGVGDGTFTSPATANPTMGARPYSVVAGDLNGDGNPDVITTVNQGGEISVRLGNGDGTFAANVTVSVDQQPYGLVLADFNGDGKLDVATANNASNNVSVLINKGLATVSFDAKPVIAVGTGPRGLTAADINGDGRLDLLSANYSSDNVTLLLGQGNGDFVKVNTPVTLGTQPAALAIADLDGDGLSDLVGTSQNTSNLVLRLGICQ